MCWILTVWSKVIIFMTHHLSHQTYKISFQIHHLLRLLSVSYFFLFNSLLFLQFTGLNFFISLSLWVFLLLQNDESNERGSSRVSDHHTWHWRRGSFFFNWSSSKTTTTAVDLFQIFNFLKSMFLDLVAETIMTISIRSQRKMKKIDK